MMGDYLLAIERAVNSIDPGALDRMAKGIAAIRDTGRLFILGCGGGAGHASHAVNDFRKLCNVEAYAPTDNVSELTANTNDHGWEHVFTRYLDVSKFSNKDALLIFSVGGGSLERKLSVNISNAVLFAKSIGARSYGIVGSANGDVGRYATEAVVVKAPAEYLTPVTESLQAVIWHGLVSHPDLQKVKTTW